MCLQHNLEDQNGAHILDNRNSSRSLRTIARDPDSRSDLGPFSKVCGVLFRQGYSAVMLKAFMVL